MGWLFELYYDENGIWKKSVIRNHKVYFEPIVEPNTNYNPFTHWKKVKKEERNLFFFIFLIGDMKKEILAPGNIVLGADREITLIELREQIAIDSEGNSWSYENLDGILITQEQLIKDGFSERTLSTNNYSVTDYIKLITVTEVDFFTICISLISAGTWKLEIFDKNYQTVCYGHVNFWHTIQNLISTYVLR